MINRRALMTGMLVLFAIPAMASQEVPPQLTAQTPPDPDVRGVVRCKVWAKCKNGSIYVCRVGCHATDAALACEAATNAARTALNCPDGDFEVVSQTICPTASGCPCSPEAPESFAMARALQAPVFPSEHYSWRIQVRYECCNGASLDVIGSGCSRCGALQSAWSQAQELAVVNGGVKCCSYEILKQPCCCCPKSPRRCRR